MNKLFIPDTSHLVSKTLEDVKKEIEEKYIGKGYRFPTEEEWKKLDLPKDSYWYYNFGSLVRDSDGYWDVPCTRWDGSQWSRCANWLDFSWFSDCRVVLLETYEVEIDDSIIAEKTAIELLKSKGYKIIKEI